jgi:hypothetical protein
MNPSTSVSKWDDQTSWPPAQSEGNADPHTGKPKRLEVRVSNGGAIVAATNYNWQAYRRVSGSWQTAQGNQLIVNNTITYPIIWVRQEAVDTWTAAGSWSGSSYSINGNGSGKLTKTVYDNTATVRGYGNVTAVEEHSHDATSIALANWNSNVASSGLTLLRKTTTDYVPNVTAYIVNKPARVRIYDSAGRLNSFEGTSYTGYRGQWYHPCQQRQPLQL